MILNLVSIHQRPEIVTQRLEFVHWEGDSVVYANKKSFNTVNKLVSGLVIFTKLERKTADLTIQAMINALKPYTASTLTLDNGCMFVKHELITKSIGVQIFFCDPYSSFQRGSNENNNGLLRRYLLKQANIDDLTQLELDDIAQDLNSRPRKRLKYLSPLKFYEKYVLNLNIGVNVAFEFRL